LVFLLVQHETFLLDYDASVAEELTKHWKRYKLRMKVTLEDKSDSLGTVAALPAVISSSDNSFIDGSSHVQDLLKLNEREPSADHGAVFCDPRGEAFGVRAILPIAEKRTFACA
jgi:transferase CAF17, mitochondrial